MRKIEVIMTVMLCALMVCCKKKGKLTDGSVLNISFLDSIGFPDSIRDVEGFSFTHNGNTYLYCILCPMLDSAKIEFNKHFAHKIQDVTQDETELWAGMSEKSRNEWLNFCEKHKKETGFYPQQIIYESERELDTMINKTIYTFTTDINPHRDHVELLRNNSDATMETFN